MVTKVNVIRRRGTTAASNRDEDRSKVSAERLTMSRIEDVSRSNALWNFGSKSGVAMEGNTEKKRPPLWEDDGANERKEKRRKIVGLVDLKGVPDQPPIRKSDWMKGTSVFVGVHYKEVAKKWMAQINIDGTKYHIGSYEHEEDAAKDYARALFKYSSNKHRHRQEKFIDLSDVPEQAPILSTSMFGMSKWRGVSFNKNMNKWLAKIVVDKKKLLIGYYDIEEDAAKAYARALFKYNPGECHQRPRQGKFIDLTGVPEQPPIKKKNSSGKCEYMGAYYSKGKDKWLSQIMVDKKLRYIGYYDNEVDAAKAYARAVYKYRYRPEGIYQPKVKNQALQTSQKELWGR